VSELVAWQVGKLAEISGTLHHVKPHGALYNQANRDASLAAAVVRGILEISPNALLYAPPAGALTEAGRAAGLIIRAEGFADRRYLPDGNLMPRSQPGAVISSIDDAVDQALALISAGRIETLCVHGDGVHAVEMLRAIRAALENAGIAVRA
jgi:UPF0271 protein